MTQESQTQKATGPCAGRWYIVPAMVTPCQKRSDTLHVATIRTARRSTIMGVPRPQPSSVDLPDATWELSTDALLMIVGGAPVGLQNTDPDDPPPGPPKRPS